MFKKRLIAYIVDILILNIILSFVISFIPASDSLINLNNELMEISNSYLDSSIDFSTYFNRYINVSYNIDKELFLSNLISVFVSVIYFIVYPLYNNGQSFGKKLMKIKISFLDDSSFGANGLIFRYMFMNSIGVLIISLCLLFCLNSKYYVLCTFILGILQFLLEIISIFMVLYRRDKRSLPDLIAGTKVIEVIE